MDFESPDVEKDFPGLYASESGKKSNESDFSDDTHERILKKDLLIGKRKDKKDSKKDRGYATLEGESSPEEDSADIRSPSKTKKSKPFKFPSKKEKREKSREKENKDKEIDKDKDKKKDSDKEKEKKKDLKTKLKSKDKERKKLKHGDDSCDIGEEQPVFGVSLPLALERSRCHDGVEIPLVVRECIMHIQENGLLTEGLYKISGIKSKVQHLRRLYNQREPVSLSEYDLPVATSLLKLFCRELPETLLTNKLTGKFEEASNVRDIAMRGVELKSLIQQLPSCNRQLLSWIIKHLDAVSSHEKQNKMSAQSLSQILSQPLQMSQKVLASLICHCDILFDSTKLKKYIPPLTSSSGSLPETADEISKELRKQESLLGQIHSEMHAGYVTKQREELLWEVQRMITQLKRKLRSLEKEAVEINHVSSIQQHYHGTIGNNTTGGSIDETDNSITANVTNITVESNTNNKIETHNANVIRTDSISPSDATANSTNIHLNNISNVNITNKIPVSSGTRHIVEAVIETNNDNIISNKVSEDISPQLSSSSFTIDNNICATGVTDSVSTNEKLTLDELSLTLETEELLALAAHLQSQIEMEQSEIISLRSQIRSLGGSPSFCDYLLESCSKDSVVKPTNLNDKDVTSSIEEQNGSLLKQIKAESQVLQMQKKSLTEGLIEEQESVARLRIQVKLLSLNSSDSNSNNLTSAVTITTAANNLLMMQSPSNTTVSSRSPEDLNPSSIGHAPPQCLAR